MLQAQHSEQSELKAMVEVQPRQMEQVPVAVGWAMAQLEVQPVFKVADIPMEAHLPLPRILMQVGE
jgi:hypothetical protein